MLAWLSLARKRQRERMAADLSIGALASRAKPDAIQTEIKKLLAE
jgi:hypothetical protein